MRSVQGRRTRSTDSSAGVDDYRRLQNAESHLCHGPGVTQPRRTTRLEETLTVIMSSHQPELLSPTARPSPSVPCPHGVMERFELEGALRITQFQPQHVNQAIRADELVAFPIQLHSNTCMGTQLLAYPRVRSAARPTSGGSPAKPHSSE